jgi:centrosomal protein CEP41
MRVALSFMSVPKPIGDPNILTRRLNHNPKFSDVDSVVDSGTTVNTLQRQRESEVSVKRNPNEKFRRLRPSTVARVIVASMRPPEEPDTEGYALPQAPPALKILLLDLRERQDFDTCHIHTAVHYPAPMINRSTNNMTHELLAFKNKEGHLVVLYDLEEELVTTRNFANVFFERGFDNIGIISGGLKEFVQEHHDLISGPPPCPIVPRKPPPPSASRRLGGNDAASTMATSVNSHKPKSLSTSLARRNESTGSGWR